MTTRQTTLGRESAVKTRAHFPPRRILVPLDLTEESLAGWKQAQTVAGWFGASVEAVYVQPWMSMSYALALGGGYTVPYFSEDAMKAAEERLRKRLGPDAAINHYPGGIEDGIMAWARSGFDLLVMATHGRTGLERALKGSIAEHVVRHSPIPVLVVRKKVSAVRLVLAPISFEPEARDGLLAAGHVAERLGARLDVLHVVSGGLAGHASVRGLKRVMEDWIGRLPERIRQRCRPRVELAFGSAAARICEAGQRADLVVLSAHRKGLLSETVLGATAERVVRHCPTPVLTLPSVRGRG